jgi:hypothetical protein
LHRSVNGVTVVAIDAANPSAAAGLEGGEVIDQIDRHPVSSPKDGIARHTEAGANPDRSALLPINRGGTDALLALSREHPAATSARRR